MAGHFDAALRSCSGFSTTDAPKNPTLSQALLCTLLIFTPKVIEDADTKAAVPECKAKRCCPELASRFGLHPILINP